jgi:hypothetical protein
MYFTIYALNGDLGKLVEKSGEDTGPEILALAQDNNMILDEATISAKSCTCDC